MQKVDQTMAKRKSGGKNKSQAIRDYYNANPAAKPKEVASELKKKGIQVTPAFVSTIRSTSKKKNGKIGRPGRPVGSTSKRSANGEVSYESLLQAKKIVDQMGGLSEAKSALSALENLIG